jgi:hypothetical protein
MRGGKMNKVWPWIFGIAFGLIIIAMVGFGQSDRQSYWVARKAMDQPVVVVVIPSERAAELRLHHYYQR